MADLGWIHIPNWERFQTYDTNRNTSGRPPWIKIYTNLMSDDAYLELTGDQRAILHGLWLEYASSSPRARLDDAPTTSRLRADTRSLTRRLNLRVTSAQLKRLADAGFIVLLARSANARDTQDALASRAREEVEESREESLVRSSRSEIRSATRPDLTESDKEHKEDEEPFAIGPEPAPLNGTRDGYGPQPLVGEVEELARRWSQESA